MAITVYGASDDLIEIEGDINEEFSALQLDEDGGLLAFSDGTVLRVRYSETGVWRITPVAAGSAIVTVDQAPEDDDSNYSDRAEIEPFPAGSIAWVVLGTEIAKR